MMVPSIFVAKVLGYSENTKASTGLQQKTARNLSQTWSLSFLHPFSWSYPPLSLVPELLEYIGGGTLLCMRPWLYQQLTKHESLSILPFMVSVILPWLRNTYLRPMESGHSSSCVCFLHWLYCSTPKTLDTELLVNICGIKGRSPDSLLGHSVSQIAMFNKLFLNVCLLCSWQ